MGSDKLGIVLRVLLFILLNVLLIGASQDVDAPLVDELVAWAQDTRSDCCPPSAEAAEEGDCCDYDFGKCCFTLVAALPGQPPVLAHTPAVSVEEQEPPQAARLQPQATGPPPFRPPIA